MEIRCTLKQAFISACINSIIVSTTRQCSVKVIFHLMIIGVFCVIGSYFFASSSTNYGGSIKGFIRKW